MSNGNGRHSDAVAAVSTETAVRQLNEELQSLYEGASEGILAADVNSRQVIRVNSAMCELLGYSKEELLSLSVADIHPPEHLPRVLETFDAMCRGRLKYARNIPCLRKDGAIVCTDVAASQLCWHTQPMIVGFFRDVTEQNRTIELLLESEQRHRLIADHASDVIWIAPLTLSDAEREAAKSDVERVVDAIIDRWRFSFISPAVERIMGYTVDEAIGLSLRAFIVPDSFRRMRNAMIVDFFEGPSEPNNGYRHRPLELQAIHKDGSIRWNEIVSAYLRDEEGMPTGILGITRDITERRKAEQALRESESKLRSLFENLPDLVATIDRAAHVHFVNRGTAQVDREMLLGTDGFGFLSPAYQKVCRNALDQAFATGQPQAAELQDIFGHWWSSRLVPLDLQDGTDLAMMICADITQERLATEAVNKEQRLLRQLLELHERERRIIAYEIHDGFAQQLTGALFRMQAFKEMAVHKSEKAWEDFDSGLQLISHAIDDARRLISGLRPPILDESGIIEAIEYLICERERQGGPKIEFVHDVAFERLAPPLESAVFRIVQESLQNASRHSQSDTVRVELIQRGNRIHVEVRDWGVGFDPKTIEEQRFGLQGIRERVRLLDGQVVIESSPGKGTHITVDLPFAAASGDSDTIDPSHGQ